AQVLRRPKTPHVRRPRRQEPLHGLDRRVVDYDHLSLPVRDEARDAPERLLGRAPVDDDGHDATHASTSSYTVAVRSAVSSQRNPAARSRARVARSRRRAPSARSCAIAPASASTVGSGTRSPASPTTSGMDVTPTATTAHPAAIASAIVS